MTSVDAHHHYWRHGESHQSWRGPEHDAIARDYQPEHLAPLLAKSAVGSTVLVQSVNTEAENDRLVDYARHTASVGGIVAWLPVDDPDRARPMLDLLRNEPAVCGVRTLVGHDDLDWLARADVVDLFTELAAAGLAWDVVPVTERQTRAVLALVERVPTLRLVVDHLGRPPVPTRGWQPWADLMRDLASSPSTAVKVSVGIDVLTSWSAWRADELRRYVAHVVEAFGPSRLMLASNWPVVELRCGYVQTWNDLDGLVRDVGVSGSDLDEVRGGTARRWYGLR